VVLLAATVAAVALVDRWLAALGAAVLLMATGEVLLPTRYAIDADGVRLQGLVRARRLRWVQLAGWRRAGDGIQLLGAGRHPLLRRRRSVVLRAAPQAIGPLLEQHLGPAR